MNEYKGVGKDWFDFKWFQAANIIVEGSYEFKNARRYELKEQDLPLSELIERCFNSFIIGETYDGYPIKAIRIYLTNDDFKDICIPFEYGITDTDCVLQLIKVIDEIDLELDDVLLFTDTIKKIKSINRKPIKGTTRQNVLMRDNYTCQICGATVKDGAKLEIDHIVPYSKGGTNDESNLQVLCQQCNREKHNRSDLLHDELKLAELKGV